MRGKIGKSEWDAFKGSEAKVHCGKKELQKLHVVTGWELNVQRIYFNHTFFLTPGQSSSKKIYRELNDGMVGSTCPPWPPLQVNNISANDISNADLSAFDNLLHFSSWEVFHFFS